MMQGGYITSTLWESRHQYANVDVASWAKRLIVPCSFQSSCTLADLPAQTTLSL